MKQKSRILKQVLAEVGSASKLASLLGLTRAAVSCWTDIPVKHVRAISDITGIPKHKLRPDIYD